jgi:beta-lactam-binding protein with PASTA domain
MKRIIAVAVLLALIGCEAEGRIGLQGPPAHRVPDVLGMTRAAAVATLRAEGFDPIVRQKWSTVGKDGRVIRQGARGIDEPPVVQVLITVRRRLHMVPDVDRLTLERARRVLRRAGFRVRVIERAGGFLASLFDPGTVLRTRPGSFGYGRPGRAVTIVVKAEPKVIETEPSCHPSYSGCVPIASDVDCAGGSGNGPAYVEGPVYINGSDPYGLDGYDNDGVGCE